MSDEDTSGAQGKGAWWGGMASVIEKVTTRNILTPLHWLVAIVAAVTIVAMVLDRDAQWPLLWTFLVLAVIDAIAYWYFVLRDPDRLQTEQHVIEKKTLETKLLADDRHQDNPEVVVAAEPIENKYVPAIPPPPALPDPAPATIEGSHTP